LWWFWGGLQDRRREEDGWGWDCYGFHRSKFLRRGIDDAGNGVPGDDVMRMERDLVVVVVVVVVRCLDVLTFLVG
jgi:hypothetical protein